MTRTLIPDRAALRIARRLFRDDDGFILSAELILMMTFLIMAAVVGFAVVKDAIATELNDVSNAIGSFDQSFTVSGLQAPSQGGVDHGTCAGFGFTDNSDTCDRQVIQISGGGGGEGFDVKSSGDARVGR